MSYSLAVFAEALLAITSRVLRTFMLFSFVCSSNPSHLLIVGDFNVPDIDWNTNLSVALENHYSHHLLETINDCILVQHVTEPTTYRQQEACSILDLSSLMKRE